MDTIKNAAASAAAAASNTAQAAYQNAPSAETISNTAASLPGAQTVRNVANQAVSTVQNAAANVSQENTKVHVQVPSDYPAAISFREIVGAPVTKASTEDSILIIIDAQNEYAEGKLTVRNITYTRAAIAALLEKYRLRNAPIIHILHDTPQGAPVFTPGTRLAEEFEELKPRLPTKGPSDIIQSTTSTDPLDAPAQEFRGVKESKEVTVHKQFPGAFTGTNLEELIRGFGRKKVVITGYMAHVCVSTTTRQAAERGLEVCVVGDAVGDRDIPVGNGVDGQGRKVQASGIGGAAGPVKAVISGEDLTATVLAELEDGFATVLSSKDIV